MKKVVVFCVADSLLILKSPFAKHQTKNQSHFSAYVPTVSGGLNTQ